MSTSLAGTPVIRYQSVLGILANYRCLKNIGQHKIFPQLSHNRVLFAMHASTVLCGNVVVVAEVQDAVDDIKTDFIAQRFGPRAGEGNIDTDANFADYLVIALRVVTIIKGDDIGRVMVVEEGFVERSDRGGIDQNNGERFTGIRFLVQTA